MTASKTSEFVRGHNPHAKDRPTLTDIDQAWLAGLIEGEGSIDTPLRRSPSGDYRGVTIHLGMTDEDVIARFAQMVGCRSYHTRRQRSGRQALYTATVSEPYALTLLLRLHPLMGQRRSARIEAAVQTIPAPRWPLPDDVQDLWNNLRKDTA